MDSNLDRVSDDLFIFLSLAAKVGCSLVWAVERLKRVDKSNLTFHVLLCSYNVTFLRSACLLIIVTIQEKVCDSY